MNLKTLNQPESYQRVSGRKQGRSSYTRLIDEILDNTDVRINGTRPWDIRVHHPSFYRRVLSQASLGLGESYMEGWWDCEALDQLFAKLSRAQMEGRFSVPLFLSFPLLKSLFLNLQDKGRSFRNGQHHYDIGNDFYQAMLDKRMVYTCAYWKNAVNLNDAQEAKLELVCQKLQLKPGMKVLDIGCGWGSFVKYAAQNYGIKAVGITVAQNQVQWARDLCHGLTVDIRLQDYRDVHEEFDRVVSLGMFEHVGQKNYRTYMKAVHSCLKKDGIFVMQSIGGNASSFYFDPWMNKYIFPGAGIPSIKQIGQAAEGLFIMEEWSNTGRDYDKTLMSWFANFNRNWPQFKKRYDETFYRMWKYYLLSCAGLFRARKQQLWRIVFTK